MRKKLFALFLTIISLSTIFIGVVSFYQTKNIIISNVNNNLKSEANLMKGMIKASDIETFEARIQGDVNLTNKRITIIKHDGTVIFDTNASSLENHLKRPEVRDALISGEGFSERYSYTIGTSLYYYATSFDLNGEKAVIRLSVKAGDVKALQLANFKTVIISIILGSILSLILGFVYLNRIIDPIKKLTITAEKIALGDYSRRINISSEDEIGKLGNSFDLMAGRLESTISDLSDKRNNLISILKSMPDGVIVVDNSNKIMLINREAKEIFNIKGEVNGSYFIEVIRNNRIEDVLKNQIDMDTEIIIEYPEYRVLSIRVSKVLNTENKSQIGLMLFIRDITKIKQLEKMRSDFVANVSHELKTPLTSIKGFTETLKFVDDKKTRDKFLDIIDIEAERLTRLINDILTLSELENKETSLRHEKVDVVKCIDEIISIMRPIALNKGIDLKFDYPVHNLYIKGDRDKFKQMLINLIDNGIKYTNTGGKVEVIALKDDDKIKIKIMDNGIGMKEEHIKRLFERFYRADRARTRQIGGTGLGLAIVKHIVKLLDGEIMVESIFGEGTTFTIELNEY